MIALTRNVGPSIEQCNLTFIPRRSIDVAKATRQHHDYKEALTQLGLEVIALPYDAKFPDGVFIEDPALVLDEMAVITRMGVASRSDETESIASVLSTYRRLEYLTAPAILEGGDVLRIDKTLYVGISSRTNIEAVEQLRVLLAPCGYQIKQCQIQDCLHLKTACSYIGKQTILINPDWISADVFDDFNIIEIDTSEPFSANTLTVGDTLLLAAGAPRTRQRLINAGFKVSTVDISELSKAEAGLTCLSQIFSRLD